jgi:hypothetical protein
MANHLRGDRRLVRIVHAGEHLDLPTPRSRVHSFAIARFTDLDRGIDVDLDELPFFEHAPHLVSRGSVRAHRRAQRHSVVADDFGGDEPDPEDVQIPVLFGEPETSGQVGANDIAIEYRHLPAVFHQENR